MRLTLTLCFARLLLAITIGAPAYSFAACYDNNALNRYPSDGVDVFFEIQEGASLDKPAVAAAGKIVGEGEMWFDGSNPPYTDQYLPQYSAFVWENYIDPKKYDKHGFTPKAVTEKAADEDQSNYFVYFYEKASSGKLRLCRKEQWASRGHPKSYNHIRQWNEPSLSLVPALKKATSQLTPSRLYTYEYDKNDRLIEWRQYGFSASEDDWSASKPSWVLDGAITRNCFIWNNQGKLFRYISSLREGDIPCNKATRGNASFMEYRYTPTGDFVGSVQVLDGNPGHPENGQWSEIYRLRPKPDVYNEAESDDRWGLKFLTGLPQIEDVPDHRLPDDQLRAIYRFPQYTPTSVMDGLPLSVKAHRRIREGPATGMGTVSEMFPPNGGLTERVFWSHMGGVTFRHERFKNGKVYRIINDGLLEEDTPTKIYSEDWAVLDKVLAHPKINVPRKNVRLRIYEVDASGKQKLVALSWAKRLPEPYPATGRIDPLREIANGVKALIKSKLDPKPVVKPKPATDEELRVRYTDTLGKEIWRDWDVFVAKTGYVQKIDEFYPYGNPRGEDPPLKKPKFPWRDAAVR